MLTLRSRKVAVIINIEDPGPDGAPALDAIQLSAC